MALYLFNATESCSLYSLNGNIRVYFPNYGLSNLLNSKSCNCCVVNCTGTYFCGSSALRILILFSSSTSSTDGLGFRSLTMPATHFLGAGFCYWTSGLSVMSTILPPFWASRFSEMLLSFGLISVESPKVRLLRTLLLLYGGFLPSILYSRLPPSFLVLLSSPHEPLSLSRSLSE